MTNVNVLQLVSSILYIYHNRPFSSQKSVFVLYDCAAQSKNTWFTVAKHPNEMQKCMNESCADDEEESVQDYGTKVEFEWNGMQSIWAIMFNSKCCYSFIHSLRCFRIDHMNKMTSNAADYNKHAENKQRN